MAKLRQILPYGQGLVELLFILDKQHSRTRVFTQILQLLAGISRIDAIGYATTAQDGHIGPHPLDARIGENGGALPRLNIQTEQAVGNLAHQLTHLLPAPGLPDTELFLAHPDLIAADGDRVPEHRGQGVATSKA
ncbi:MAG: hypothetical protein RL083_1267 [Pseudomonadota bacterium]